MNPKVSIIIVNFNGQKYLHDCLSSIENNPGVLYEVIFVDNASSDNSVNFVKKYFPKVTIIQNNVNLGFAGGSNIGIRQVRGEYILLLNNDTIAEKDFLRNFIKAFDEIPNLGCVQPKIVLMKDPNIIDSCGSYLTDTSFLYHYGYDKNQSLEKYNHPFPVFSVKGVAILTKKEIIEKIGLFDDDFWCYYEETDFCHRAWLAGYECWYYPKVKIYHAAGGTTLTYFQNSYIQFHNFKNKPASFIMNFEAITLLKFLPIYLVINFFLGIFFLIKLKPKYFASLIKALLWNIIHIKRTLLKRHHVQLLRKISDKDIFRKVKRNPKLSYYYYQQIIFKLKYYIDEPYKMV